MYRHRRAGLFRIAEKLELMAAQHRMHDGLKPLHGIGIVHNHGRQLLPIHLAVHRAAWKRRFDGRRSLALVDLMDGGVGVIDGTPASSNSFAVVDFPIPIEPVKPSSSIDTSFIKQPAGCGCAENQGAAAAAIPES